MEPENTFIGARYLDRFLHLGSEESRQQYLPFMIYLGVTLCLCAAMWHARGAWDKAQVDGREAIRIEAAIAEGSHASLSLEMSRRRKALPE